MERCSGAEEAEGDGDRSVGGPCMCAGSRGAAQAQQAWCGERCSKKALGAVGRVGAWEAGSTGSGTGGPRLASRAFIQTSGR